MTDATLPTTNHPASHADDHSLLLELQARLREIGNPAIAFSGGLDSRFLSHTALRLGLMPVLYHVRGPHTAPEETAWAFSWAKKNGLVMHGLDFDPLTLDAVRRGAQDRCYYCKRAMFSLLRRNLGEGDVLCDGTNASDKKAWRPGLRALEELGVLSPLALAGLEKPRIRALAEKTGLERPGQQARPCLLTRLDYGFSPDADLLALVARMEACAEAALCRHLPHLPEAPDFRVRVTAQGGFLLQVEPGALSGREKGLFSVFKEAFSAHGLPMPEIFFAASVSGYFDAAAQAPPPFP